jgi:hypothetical protein
MSGPGNPPLPSKVLCSVCLRENTLGPSPFCKYCGSRLQQTTPAGVAGGQNPDIQDLLAQVSSLQAELKVANTVASGHAATVAKTQSDLKEAQASNSSHIEKIKAHEGLEAKFLGELSAIADKLKEAKAAASGHQETVTTLQGELLAANVKLQEAIKTPVISRLKMIAGGLVLMLGSLGGGYTAAPHFQPKNPTKTDKVAPTNTVAQANAAAQLAAAQQEAAKANTDRDAAIKLGNDTKVLLDAAKKNVDGLNVQVKQLKVQAAKQPQLETDLATAKQNLASAKPQLNAAIAAANQSADALARLKSESESTIKARDGDISNLKAQIVDLNAKIAAFTRRSGTLTWSGFIMGKRKIEIKNGGANYGALSGALPGKPCTLVAPDPDRVQLKTLPSAKNQWNQMAFEVSGSGNLQVQINWVATQ